MTANIIQPNNAGTRFQKVYASLITEPSSIVNSSNPLSTGIYGYQTATNAFEPIKIDAATNSLCTLNYEHCEIHSGSHFFIRGFKDLASQATHDIYIVTGNTTRWPHMTIAVENEIEGEYQLFEGCTVTASGVLQTNQNRDRNSTKVSSLAIYSGATIATVGASMAQSRFGSARSYGGSQRDSEEIILKQNTRYLFRMINRVNGTANLFNWLFDWYDHTNKN